MFSKLIGLFCPEIQPPASVQRGMHVGMHLLCRVDRVTAGAEMLGSWTVTLHNTSRGRTWTMQMDGISVLGECESAPLAVLQLDTKVTLLITRSVNKQIIPLVIFPLQEHLHIRYPSDDWWLTGWLILSWLCSTRSNPTVDLHDTRSSKSWIRVLPSCPASSFSPVCLFWYAFV